MAGPYYVDNVAGNDGNAGTSEGAGNAWATIQKAADTVAAGEIAYIKASGTYTLTSTCDFDANFGSEDSGPCTFIGYTSTIDDGGQPTVTKTGAVDNIFKSTVWYLHIKNFIVHSADADNIIIGPYSTLENITSYGAGQDGIIADNNVNIIDCTIHTNTRYGIKLNGKNDIAILGNFIYNNTDTAIQAGTPESNGCLIEKNVIHNNGNYGINGVWLINANILDNVIDAGVNGVASGIGAYRLSRIYGNIISNYDTGGKYGIENVRGTYKTTMLYGNNAFYNCDTPVELNTMLDMGGNIVLSADPYTDASSDNFSLNDTVGGGADCKGAGYPSTMPDATGASSNIAIGVWQNATLELPAVGDVRFGTSYGVDGTEFTGTLDLPAIADVKVDVVYDNTTKTGLYTGSDRWTDPDQDNVKDGVEYKANSLTNNKTGNVTLPVASNVKTSIQYGTSGTEYEGTLESTDPGIANVIKDVAYLIANASLVGTFDESLRNTDPGISNVTDSITYKILNVDYTGTFDESLRNTDPGIANVLLGTTYKILGADLVGTYVLAGTPTVTTVTASDYAPTDTENIEITADVANSPDHVECIINEVVRRMTIKTGTIYTTGLVQARYFGECSDEPITVIATNDNGGDQTNG